MFEQTVRNTGEISINYSWWKMEEVTAERKLAFVAVLFCLRVYYYYFFKGQVSYNNIYAKKR